MNPPSTVNLPTSSLMSPELPSLRVAAPICARSVTSNSGVDTNNLPPSPLPLNTLVSRPLGKPRLLTPEIEIASVAWTVKLKPARKSVGGSRAPKRSASSGVYGYQPQPHLPRRTAQDSGAG